MEQARKMYEEVDEKYTVAQTFGVGRATVYRHSDKVG
jgi:helix-turn-helix resolvase-like protein